MHLRLHGQAAHPQSERQRDGEQLPALHVPWLPANSRHRCRQRGLPMVPVLGPDAVRDCAPAGHPQRRRLVRLRVGSDQERHGNLRESRLSADGLYLHALRRSRRRRGRHPAHPVEQRIQRRGTGAGLLQLPASQSARRKVDQPRSHQGTRRLEFI